MFVYFTKMSDWMLRISGKGFLFRNVRWYLKMSGERPMVRQTFCPTKLKNISRTLDNLDSNPEADFRKRVSQPEACPLEMHVLGVFNIQGGLLIRIYSKTGSTTVDCIWTDGGAKRSILIPNETSLVTHTSYYHEWGHTAMHAWSPKLADIAS